MAYLGFQGMGGANVRWPLVLTQRGPNQVISFLLSNFFYNLYLIISLISLLTTPIHQVGSCHGVSHKSKMK